VEEIGFGSFVVRLKNSSAGSIEKGELFQRRERRGRRVKGNELFRVGQVPVDRREMFSLSELLVESPEDLNDTESGSSNGIREISTRRRDAVGR